MKRRWIDLSEHGMKLILAVLPNTRALVIDRVPEEHAAAVASLGFKKRNSGSWVKAGTSEINPRPYLKLFPKAKIKEMEREEYLVELNKPASSQTASDAAAEMPEAKFIGINRLGQKVFEEDGRRYVQDSRGRRMQEDASISPMPGMFLRATDEASLAMCAEGYLETVLSGSDGDAVSAEKFMEAAGVRDKEAFLLHLGTAVTRNITKKGSDSLRERYGRAAAAKKGLGQLAVPGLADFDRTIIARRLIGLDRNIVGRSVYSDGEAGNLLSQLLPRAVRREDDPKSADIAVSFRSSLMDASTFLAGRDPGTMTVTFVPVEDSAAARAALEKLGTHGPVEAASYIDLSPDDRYLAVVSAAGSPAPLPAVKDIREEGEVWSWASMVVTDRSKAAEAVKSGLSTLADLTFAEGVRNTHQVPYASASKAGKPKTMLPKELEAPTRIALDRVISNFGDVDDRVAVECGFPRGEIGNVLSPEQVDAVALQILAEERGRGFLLADNTGTGKGRALVTIAKRALLQGRKVIIFSEKPSNLSDLQRDVKHIGALDIIKPAVMNKGVLLVDEDTGNPFETESQEELYAAVERGEWPEGINCIFATYSQFNKSPEESSRARWLQQAVDSEVVLIADEVHNAASGDSNTSRNIASAVNAAGSVVMSSATFASHSKMIPFFERIFPDDISAAEIASMMRKGGEPFQEVVSSMLVADGVMIRREKDLSSLKITQHLDEARVQRNRDYMDALAAVIGEMALLSGELDGLVSDHNENQGNMLKGLQMKRMHFGSPLYRVTRLFTASLLTEFTAERAIEALKNGEKPIILVENTVQGVLEDALAANGGKAPAFKDVLHRVLDQLTKVTVVNAEGDAERVDAAGGNRRFAAATAHIRAMIDELPSLPASPIDEVRRLVSEAGFTVEEMTGRTLRVDDGKVVPRRNRDNNAIKNAFNRGEYDALIINSAGSTGVDLHASARFKDQRPRVMIELQSPSDVVKQIQAFGRITRYDETVPARIELPSTGLPVEVRLSAMRNQKLRRLSANVTSNRDNIFLARDIPDLINSVGDKVVTRYAEMRPDLIKRLCLDEDADEVVNRPAGAEMSEAGQDSERSANEFLSRLFLLPTEHQEKVLSELAAEYEMQIAELEAKGENPLRPRELEGIVHIRGTKLFEGSGSGSSSAFDGPMHVLDVAIERIAEPIRAEDVMRAVEEGSDSYGKAKKAAAATKRERDLYLAPLLPKGFRTVDEAIARGNKRILQHVRNMQVISSAINELAPGREVRLLAGEDEEKAVITAIKAAPNGYEHLPHMYLVQLAIPGETSMKTFRLDTLLQDFGVAYEDGEEGQRKLKFRVEEGLEGANYDEILERFENAVAKKLKYGRVLTTNIFRAVRLAAQHNLGSLVSFVDSEGNRHRGVLVKPSFERRLEQMSVRLEGVESAMHALTEVRAELNSSPAAARRSILITPIGQDSWQVKLPAPVKKGAQVKWPTEGYRLLFEGGVPDEKNRRRITVSGEPELREILETLHEAGIMAWFAAAKHRQALGEIVEERSPTMRAGT